jgi:predicted aspartyl protease
MGKLPPPIAVLLLTLLTLRGPHANGAVALDALGQYLTAHGYGGVQFVRHENTYRVPIISNGKAGDLTIDTGASSSVIFAASMKKLGLTQTLTDTAVHGAFGKGKERVGITNIHALTMGNCMLMNVKAAVLSEPGGHGLYREYASTDGLLGLREMINFGAVLDLRNHLLLVHPAGPQKGLSAGIRPILVGQGYTPVDLAVVDGHVRVNSDVNGTTCSLIVDTGAFLTVLDRAFARRARIGGVRSESYAQGLGTSGRPVNVAAFSIFKIGDFVIKNASVTVTDLDPELVARGKQTEAAGLLGAEYLGLHGAIFDFNSGKLYLRPKAKP